MKTRLVLIALLFSTVFLRDVMPQSDVHLFQNFMKEASVSSAPFVSGYFINNGNTLFNAIALNIQAAYPVTNSLEARLLFGPDGFCKYLFGPNGMGGYSMRQTDAELSGIYNLGNSDYLVSAGAFIDIPFKETFRSARVGYGVFGALKKPLTPKVVLTADAGLGIKNQSSIFKTIFLGAGAIIDTYEKLSVIAEGSFWTEDSDFILSGGLDYKLQPGIGLRGAVGLNLTDSREDARALIGLSYSF